MISGKMDYISIYISISYDMSTFSSYDFHISFYETYVDYIRFTIGYVKVNDRGL